MIQSTFSTPTSSAGFRIASLVALPITIIGTVMVYMVVKLVISATTMQSWPTVPATLQHVELEGQGSKSQRVVASYVYTFDGRQFNGKKASLYNSDNLGSFHQNAYDELQDYFSRQAPYPVHVNPQDPTKSILMPVLRWEVVGFYLLFVIVFGGVGWGILITSFFGAKRLRIEAQLAAQYPNEPWRHRIEWSTSKIKSSENSSAIGSIVIAILWNAFTFPILFAVPEKIKAGEYLILLALVFPLCGLGFVYWALVSIARARRFGKTYLELDTMPVRQGEQLRGRIYAPVALGEATQVQVTICCQRNYRVSSSKGGSETRTETLWKQAAPSQIIRGQSATGDVQFKVDFAIPDSFPDTSNDTEEWFTWKLVASADLTGADFEAEFEVPVFRRSSAQGEAE